MSKFQINSIKLISFSSNISCNDICICGNNINCNSIYNQDNHINSKLIFGQCKHTFHSECINPWIIKNKNCPICRLEWINNKN